MLSLKYLRVRSIFDSKREQSRGRSAWGNPPLNIYTYIHRRGRSKNRVGGIHYDELNLHSSVNTRIVFNVIESRSIRIIT
jgi:hypothetical protein